MEATESIQLTKYERQNIKRRYGCDWQTYMRAFEFQQGRCAMCNELSGKRGLKADTKRRCLSNSIRKLICLHCYYVVSQWIKDDKRAQIRAYLGLDDLE